MMRRTTRVALVFFLNAMMSASLSLARFDAGGLMGTVSDVEGNTLDEVLVVLRVGDETLEVMADEKGLFRFRDLKPGNYTLQVTCEGFSQAVYEPVNIRLGRVTTVQVQMSEVVEETIIVTSEPPTTEAGTGTGRTVLDSTEIGSIPLADDPWSIGARAAGVLSASSNTAGNPLAFARQGTDGRESTYTLDGADVTDRGREPGAAMPYDLGSASSIEIVTGGSDISHSSPGARFNLITRRGGRRQAAARLLVTDQDWNSTPALSDRVDSHRFLEVVETGAEASGSLLRDHLWGWASFANQEVRRQAVGGLVEDTGARSAAVKLDGQLGSSSAVAAYHRGDWDRTGEDAGPDRTLETTLLESQPSELLRLEETHVFSSNLYLTARYARLDTGTVSVPLGGAENEIVLGPDGVWRGSFGELSYGQDSRSWLLDGAAMSSWGDLGHEIRFGFSQQRSDHSTAERWGRDSLLNLAGENFGTPFDIVRLERPVELEMELSRIAFWFQDSITSGRLTVDFGVRHDIQRGVNISARAESNPLFPDLLPALDFSGGDAGLEWSSISPRLAAAYAFGNDGRTVLRSSYSMFASQLYTDLVSRTGPVADAQVYLGFEDRDFDNLFDDTEPHFLLAFNGIDPMAGGPSSPHTIDGSLDPERTDEFRLGVEHGFRSGVEIGLEHVGRHVTGILETRRLIRDQTGQVRPARTWDYQLDGFRQGLLPGGEPFSAAIFGLKDGLAHTGGNLLLNGGREQFTSATTLSLTRHLAGRWMLRAQASLSDSRWRLGKEFIDHDDPTDLVAAAGEDAGVSLADTDGDIVAPPAPGSFLNSRWSFNLAALYQLGPSRPWGFDLAANFRGREGFPLPYSLPVLEGDGAVREVQATQSTDSFRLDDVYLLDLRLQKELRLGALRAALSLDIFNVLNAGYVLERELQLTSPQAARVRETLSPRVLRFGLRLSLD